MGSNTGRNRKSRPRQSYTTKSGKSIKLNRSISDRKKAKRAERASERALYLASLPKNRWKRLAVRLEPKHLYNYWFSRQGAIMSLKIVGIMILAGFFLTIGLFAYFRKDMPQLKNISGANLGGTVSYYDSTGKTLLFQDYNGIKRTPVQSNQISPYMKEATVAIEDKNFYKEGAFDIRSIFRAAFHDLTGGSLQGASTITEQLVKLNEGWIGSRTIATKIKEVILAVEVNREYTKDQILTGYLNIAPYGGVDYGVQAASEDYFRVPASQLTLAQASMLAAIPQAPGYYSPYNSTKWNPAAGNSFDATALIQRQHYILQQMVQQKYISEAQAQQAQNVNVLAEVHPAESKYGSIQDPYFVLAAKQQLERQFGNSFITKGGIKVITTLNTTLQNYAIQDVKNNERNVASVGGDQQAMVAEDVKTGQVVALVGGENFNNPNYGQINYANIRLSPGSSMKPFLYSALIQNNTNVGAGSVIYDVQQPLPGYPCTNKARPNVLSVGGNCLWDDNFVYPGPETIRYALAGSRNVPAVKASYEVDPNDNGSDGFRASENAWIGMANKAIGVKNAYACYQQGVNPSIATPSQMTQCYGSSAIGAGDIALDNEVNGDVTLANLGKEMPQTYILKIVDSSNGKTIYQWHQPKGTQVYKPDTAYITDSMLDDPRATYLTASEKFQNWNGWDIAVKTGTNNQNYNGIMTAWNTQYAVIGFAGYHTLDKPLIEGHMEQITEPITRTWLEQALTNLHTKPINWTKPAGVKSLPGFVQRITTGYGAEVPGPTYDLYPSWYRGPGSNAPSTTLDKVSGFLATSCTPALAKETIGGGSTASTSADIFYPTRVPDMAALSGNGTAAKSATQTDNVHNCNDTKPSVSITASNTSNQQNGVCDVSCTIAIAASAGTHPLSGGSYTAAPAATVTIALNGQNIKTVSIPTDQSQSFNYSFSYSPTSSGSGTLTATVVDSVLYSSTGSTGLSYTAPLANFKATSSNNVESFSWTGGGGTYTVTINGQTVGNCSTTQTSCQATGITAGQTATLSDTDGDPTQTTSTQ